ncbi:uncharacterized protein RSE6_15123 [Rhynchosporium secalis]|uniref:RING-type domain-containing protein n=1 Tax=Rhynchosporium secalis TaxID=38038 RepID=A0A1E1MWR0_RHYSE|nr:uncharacterized protein RSE6_15123 [Rhynchosporium secalis]
MDEPTTRQGLKRKASWALNNDSKRSQKRRGDHSVRTSTLRAKRPIITAQVIDLTSDIDHCAVCPNILGQGEDGLASMFAFTLCGCIRCGQCLCEIIPVDQEGKIAGVEGVYCSKDNHFEHGEQAAWRIFGRGCGICSTTSDEGGDIYRTQCGHTFCIECITKWVEEEKKTSCPCCRVQLSYEVYGFNTFSRGVVSSGGK